MSGASIPRRGTTLVELLVALAILGMMLGVVGLAFRPAVRVAAASPLDRIAEARRRAIATGRPVPLSLTDGDTVAAILALPDGSVLGAARFQIDGPSGRPMHAAR